VPSAPLPNTELDKVASDFDGAALDAITRTTSAERVPVTGVTASERRERSKSDRASNDTFLVGLNNVFRDSTHYVTFAVGSITRK